MRVAVSGGNWLPCSRPSPSITPNKWRLRSLSLPLGTLSRLRGNYRRRVLVSASPFSEDQSPSEIRRVLSSRTAAKEGTMRIRDWCRLLIPLSCIALWSVPSPTMAMAFPVQNHVCASLSSSTVDTEIGLGDVLRYKFQRLMSQRLSGKLLAVVISALPIVILGGILYKFITGSSLRDGMFKAFTIVGDIPGADAVQEENPLALLVGNVIFFWGVLTVAVTIGIVCEDIDTYVTDVRHGNYQVVEKDHVVILNVNHLLGSVLNQISEASKERGSFRCPIIILADVDKTELEERIGEEVEGLNLEIFTRRGCTHDVLDLKRVAAGKAKYVIWLEPEEDEEVSVAARRACAIAAIKTLGTGRNEGARMVVQTSHNSVNSIGQFTDVPLAFRTPPVTADHKLSVMEQYEEENFDRLLAQCALQPGLSTVLSDICHHSAGKEFYVSSGRGFGGELYSTARRHFPSAAVCGIFTPASEDSKEDSVQLNPSEETVLQTDDRLLLLCNSAKDTYPSSTPAPKTELPESVVVHNRRPHFSKNLVVLCFGKEGYVDSGAVESIGMFAPEGTKMTVVSTKAVDTNGKTGRSKVSFLEGNPASFSTLKKLGNHKIDSVLLAGLEDLPPKIADAQLISSLIQIQEVANKHWKKNEALNVVSPMNFRDTKQVADHLIAEGKKLEVPIDIDILLPSELVSGMLVQVAASPILDTVFKELMKVKGTEIYIRDASEFCLVDQSLKANEVSDIVRKHQESFLGLMNKDGDVELAPEGTNEHRYHAGDKVVVLANAFEAALKE